MLIDITLKITPKMSSDDVTGKKPELAGHLGTHFDVMNKEFPLEYTKRKGIMFDVSGVCDRDIEIADIDINKIKKYMFVTFYTGYIEKEPYGTKKYFSEHPQLSHDLINILVEKGVSIIGLDFGGIRRGKEHVPKDQYCADNGVFVIENLCNLQSVLQNADTFTVNTYPMNFVGVTGLPCRVIAEV